MGWSRNSHSKRKASKGENVRAKKLKKYIEFMTNLLKKIRSFFQSVCVLGYCVFPINISAFIIALTKTFLPYIVKLAFVVGSFSWATVCKLIIIFKNPYRLLQSQSIKFLIASVGFMATLVSEEKKIMAVFPVFLFYMFLSWFTLVA